MNYEDMIAESQADHAREYEADRNDAAWDEYGATLEDAPTETEIDEMAAYFVSFIATSPEGHMTRENMPLPEECRPVSRNGAIVDALKAGYTPDLDSLSHAELSGLVHYMAGTMKSMEATIKEERKWKAHWLQKFSALTASVETGEVA